MEPFQRVTAVVDLGAVERNCRTIGERLAPEVELCAVVKANAYGHGMAECAGAALRGGVDCLAVATASEAFELRGRVGDARIVTLGALTEAELDVALQAGAELTIWRRDFLDEVERRAAEFGMRAPVHVKYDSGLGRLGTPDPGEARELVERCVASESLRAAGLWTHFATADADDDGFLATQLERFRALALPLREEHPGLRLHAANSAATLRGPDFHFDMVRCGVAIYGLDPFGADPADHGLEPALSLHSYVADVKTFGAGDSAGYGRTWIAAGPTDVGVVPVGYGDGLRRAAGNRTELLVGGRRRPLSGTVSMDNVTVDLGPGSDVLPGAPAVIIGRQGEEEMSAEELARRLETINYEITCALSSRVPRAFRR